MHLSSAPTVVVVGGGVAGLEAVIALHGLAAGTLEVTLLAPSRHFTWRAPVRHRYPLARLAGDHGAWFVRDGLAAVDRGLQGGVLLTHAGDRIAYDELILTPGAVLVEGFPGAFTYRGDQDAPRLEASVDAVADAGGVIAFVAHPGEPWPSGLETLAHAAASRLAAAASSGRVVRVTDGVVPAHADLAVALPVLRGPRISGVPCDAEGFLVVDENSLVRGTRVYAAGNATATTPRSGAQAARQAEIAARAIALRHGAAAARDPLTPFVPAVIGPRLERWLAAHWVQDAPLSSAA